MRHLTIYRFIDAIAKAGSIRKAAESLSITPSALNRRILTIEDEMGIAIFERLPRGVRLSTAGELMIHNIRNHIADMDRVQSQIADLSGVRRGHVSVASSQALLPYFLPEQIETYRSSHPGVTFGVFVRDREAAEQALMEYSADIALVFEPVRLSEIHTLLTVRQPIMVVMGKDHPLARQKEVRLSDTLSYPLALPSTPFGVRTLLEAAAKKKSLQMSAVVQSDNFEFLMNFASTTNALSFQIEIGLPPPKRDGQLVYRPVSSRDVPAGILYLGYLKGRALPIAVSRFAEQLATTFVEKFDCI